MKFGAIAPVCLRRVLLAVWVAALGGAAPTAAQNQGLVEWASGKQTDLRSVGQPARSTYERFNEPVVLLQASRPVVTLSGADRSRNDLTLRLYGQQIGAETVDSLIWTGIESGNPLTRDGSYRWDSLADQGLFDPARRAKLVLELNRLGIKNIRLGMSNHLIDMNDESTWSAHDALVRDLSEAGLNISLDLHHFGIEDRFRVLSPRGSLVGAQSYYLNPEWPDYFARFAAEAFRRYKSQIAAFTLINEPETTIGFNSEMWNGGFPRWSHPSHTFYYIERALQVAKAAVKARMAIEAQVQGSGEIVLFLHPEAAVHKSYWPEFNNVIRFFASDLILGADWLLGPAAGLPSRSASPAAAGSSTPDWLIRNYVDKGASPGEREANRVRLATSLAELRGLHAELKASYRVTMKSNTIFGVDYYAHNEDHDLEGVRLSAEPQHYAMQVQAGRRAGLYRVLTEYFNRYRIPMMVGESGTPFFHYGARWHQQMLLECAKAVADGVPLVGYTIYPAIDTWGWETALSVAKKETLLNPGGLLGLDLAARKFGQRLIDSLAVRMPVSADANVQAAPADDAPRSIQ